MFSSGSKMVKYSSLFASIFFHLFYIGIVIYFAWPIFSLYWKQEPAVGIDLFLSVNLLDYIKEHFNWPFMGWRYMWYGGTPLAQTYPLLHFYLMLPLLLWFSVVQSVQVYVLISYGFFLIFSYLLFFSLSKSRALAALLAIATAYSYNLWSPLYWSGSIPYAATMFLLPLSLFLVYTGYEKGSKKLIYFSALLSGLFLLGHPQSFIGYTVPITSMLLLFFWSKKVNLFVLGKLGTIFVYAMIVLLIGFPFAGVGLGIFLDFFKLISGAFSHGASEIAQSTYSDYARETAGPPVLRMLDIYKRTNPLFFWVMGISFPFALATTIFTFVLKRRASHAIKLLLPFILMFIYLLAFIYAFVLGLNPLSGGWFRVFWPTMVIFGATASVLWRISTNNLELIFDGFLKKSITYRAYAMGLGGTLGLAVLMIGIPYLKTTYVAFQKETLSFVSESSTFPTVISLNLKKGDWPEKLPKLTPSWMDPNSLEYRLYDIDATFNIWWNAVFGMPLTRGYLDAGPSGPSAGNYAGWQYLQNIIFSKNEAVERWGYSEEQARAMAAFLIDWNAIKYWEGAPAYGRNYTAAPSTYISDDKNLISRSETVITKRPAKYFQIEGRGWDIPETELELKYYEINEASTSPIYMGSNAPSILVIGDYIGQDTVMRDLGLLNINSRKGIIVQWNKPIDELGEKELKNFDMVVAYMYKYNSYQKAFKRLENYVKDGGKLFIDTGTEQKESTAQNLPDIFPFKQSERKPLGANWDWKLEESEIGKRIKFENFSEPIYDKDPWSFSYPVGPLSAGAKVIAQNHGHPVLVEQELGSGKVIWSGMNFLGHLQRFKNTEEINLLRNIIYSFADFSEDTNVKVSYERPKPEKVIIKGSRAKSVLFKEAGYSGWQATVAGGGISKKVPIYEAGPMVPGYMYIVLPEEARKGEFEVIFKYNGELIYKITYLISGISFLIILDFLFFKRILNRFFAKIVKFGHARLGKWWEKDE